MAGFRNTILAASAAASFALASATPAEAHRVEPMRYELSPSGSGAQTTLTVTNTRTFPITIETTVSLIAIDENGEETLTPAEDSFLVFPPQAVIEAGKAQALRVRYLGSDQLDTSKSYRINVNQLPVDMSEDEDNGVAITVNFGTLANVVPANSRSELSVEEVSLTPDGRWKMLVANTGTRFARMSDVDLTVSAGGQSKSIGDNETQGWFDNNLVLPGNRLFVTMPAIEGFDPASTSITLSTAS